MSLLLSPYDPSWPAEFEVEAKRLADALGSLARRIDHVGSTAVPGLVAKPVIDIQISVARVQPMEVYLPRFVEVGYSHLSFHQPLDEVYPFFHRPATWPTTHHVHVCEEGSDEELRHLAFRDWLRAHPRDRRAYAGLKQRLAEKVDEADPVTLYRYTENKTDFVKSVEERALRAIRGS